MQGQAARLVRPMRRALVFMVETGWGCLVSSPRPKGDDSARGAVLKLLRGPVQLI